MKNYKKNWLKILLNTCLKYKKANLVNIEKFEDYSNKEDKNGRLLKELSNGLNQIVRNLPPMSDAMKDELGLLGDQESPDKSDENALLRLGNIRQSEKLVEKYLSESNLQGHDGNQLYVAAVISKPGKHQYMVKYPTTKFLAGRNAKPQLNIGSHLPEESVCCGHS